MDFVQLLREYVVSGKAIKYDTEKNEVVFANQRFPKDTATNFQGQNGKQYTLEDVWFMLQHREKPWLQYVKECNAFKFQIVSFLDHKELLGYLTGKTNASSKITAPVEVATKRPAAKSAATVVTESQGEEGLGSESAASLATEMIESGGSLQEYQPLAGLEDDEEDAEGLKREAEQRPLTEAELKVKRRKEETIQLDREQMMQIGSAREMKLREILEDAEVVAALREGERPATSKEMLMRSKTRSFKHILNLMYLRQTDGRNRMRGGTQAVKRARPQGDGAGDKRKRATAAIVPIIIVPAAMTSNIGLMNARDFLEQGQWVAISKKKEEAKTGVPVAMPGSKVPFSHTTLHEDGSETEARFEVVDSVRGFTKEHWRRVIAIFTNGKEWELKDLKRYMGGTPQEVFHRAAGFYLAFKGDEIPPTIRAWKVSVLRLDKNARHGDVTAQREFWEILRRESSNNARFSSVFL